MALMMYSCWGPNMFPLRSVFGVIYDRSWPAHYCSVLTEFTGAPSLSLSLSLSPSLSLPWFPCCDRCEFLHDDCFSHCIWCAWIRCVLPYVHMCVFFVCARVWQFCVMAVWFCVCVWLCGCTVHVLLCALAPHVLNRELADIMHVTSPPIKPLLTGAPLSEIFHRSECEISRIRWKLQQLYIQRLSRAPNSSHLNQPLQVTRLTGVL